MRKENTSRQGRLVGRSEYVRRMYEVYMEYAMENPLGIWLESGKIVRYFHMGYVYMFDRLFINILSSSQLKNKEAVNWRHR